MFDWDEQNLKKIKAHRIEIVEVEYALSVGPILIYEQDADWETRYVYYGETANFRMLAIILTERSAKIRVITVYDLDASQKSDYLSRRANGE